MVTNIISNLFDPRLAVARGQMVRAGGWLSQGSKNNWVTQVGHVAYHESLRLYETRELRLEMIFCTEI